ncbi:Uncharacterised protein [Salmonella bongori]|nr:Uncharacterised protein [Salmonella bongori]
MDDIGRTIRKKNMQRILNTVLDSNWLWLLARLLLSVIFLSSGLAKLLDTERQSGRDARRWSSSGLVF